MKTEIIRENLRNPWIKKVFFGNHDPRFPMEGKPIGPEPASVRQPGLTRLCFRGGLYALALDKPARDVLAQSGNVPF